MRGFEGIAGNLADRLAAMGQLQQEMLERLRLTGALGVQQGEQPRDGLGRTQQEARRDRLAFSKNRPTFERGRDRWSDFALRFEGARLDYGVEGDHAKWALYNAIVGQSSRLVIASMAPNNAAMHALGPYQVPNSLAEAHLVYTNHQPSGSGNLSRASSIRLDLTVRVPPAVAVPPGFDAEVGQGWEVFVFAIHQNWVRFENGLCQKIFSD